MDIAQIITTLGVCGLVCYAVWWALQRAKSKLPDAVPVDEHAKALDYCVWLGKYVGGDCLLSEIRELAIESKYPLPPVKETK